MSKSLWDHLREALEDLEKSDFKKFTDKLCDAKLEPRVRRANVQGKDEGDVARLLLERFTERRAVEVTVQILQQINCNQVAKELLDCTTGAPEQPPVEQPPVEQPPVGQPPVEQPAEAAPPTTLIHCTQDFKEKILKEKGEEIYEVLDKEKRKRLALLINNVEFDCKGMRRNGAQRDEENMEKLLTDLGYVVVKHTNCSGQEMEEALKNFAGRSEHKESDSTFIVIMSHGKRDAILGVHYTKDNQSDVLHVDKIYQHLNNINCPGLRNKPKVILIQACRGEEHGGAWVPDSECFESDDMVHKETDFVSLLSCTPDTKSYRHVEKGTLFVGSVVEVFNGNAHKDHIEELFRQVMRRFDNKPELKLLRQMVCKERITLGKLFYLFPGL